MVKVKICGITSGPDAEAALEAGADFLGFNFYPGSPRCVDPSRVRVILADLPRAAGTVGVFVNADRERILAVCDRSGVGIVQIHGDEPAGFGSDLERPLIRVVRLSGPESLAGIEELKCWAVLVDSHTPGYGGSGQRADWNLAAQAAGRVARLILAGGLSPDNVGEAIQKVRPWAVDVASGVEKEPGVKDHDRMRKFIQAVRDGSR